VASAEEPAVQRAIEGLGDFAAIEKPGERPDPTLDYKVLMIATDGEENGEPAPALDRAARLVNLLAVSGVPADHRHIAIIIYGPATKAVLTEEARTARKLGPNPSAEPIAKLIAAGVSIRVCGQALAGRNIAHSEVLPGVEVDLSAVTTAATLQLKGYALIPQ
jgi:intracellular sulfur oxidation DsrE/DsrF family protein